MRTPVCGSAPASLLFSALFAGSENEALPRTRSRADQATTAGRVRQEAATGTRAQGEGGSEELRAAAAQVRPTVFSRRQEGGSRLAGDCQKEAAGPRHLFERPPSAADLSSALSRPHHPQVFHGGVLVPGVSGTAGTAGTSGRPVSSPRKSSRQSALGKTHRISSPAPASS